MRHINHLSDFQVIINITDKDGNIISPPSVPWEAVFSDENCVDFKCYFDGNNYTHCIVDGNDIVCFIDNPGFSCGKLRCTFYQHVQSEDYCDGVMDLSQPLQCDIMLSKRESDDSTPITIEASPNWVRGPQGENGEKGDKGDTGNPGPIGLTGPKGEQGADGFSPIVSLTKDGSISTLSITDAQGEHTTEIADGARGDDGFSPVVSLSKVDKVTTLTITDASGEHSTEIHDGEMVDIVQEQGTSTIAVMSQDAVTKALANIPSGGCDWELIEEVTIAEPVAEIYKKFAKGYKELLFTWKSQSNIIGNDGSNKSDSIVFFYNSPEIGKDYSRCFYSLETATTKYTRTSFAKFESYGDLTLFTNVFNVAASSGNLGCAISNRIDLYTSIKIAPKTATNLLNAQTFKIYGR